MFGRKPGSDQLTAESARQYAQITERNEFLLSSVRALTYFLKEFSFDLSELDAEGFKCRMDRIADSLSEEASDKRLQKGFDADKEYILDFIAREKVYFGEKEAELKKIIELLSAGLSGLIGDSEAFNARVYEGNLRMERITYLDDIRRMREDLKSEINLMRDIIREKQSKDAKMVRSLSKEVDVLKSNLERARDASMTDPLTGAQNRLAFDTLIKKLIDRNEISWRSFSILLCDLDNFKMVNDTYGHRMGDRVLRVFVDECKSLIRSDDVIARYGGEEFVIVLPGAALKHAVKRAKDICRNFASKEYGIQCQKDYEVIKFTVSIGVSEVRLEDSPEALIERADKALYEAKRNGKNRTTSEREIKQLLKAA